MGASTYAIMKCQQRAFELDFNVWLSVNAHNISSVNKKRAPSVGFGGTADTFCHT